MIRCLTIPAKNAGSAAAKGIMARNASVRRLRTPACAPSQPLQDAALVLALAAWRVNKNVSRIGDTERDFSASSWAERASTLREIERSSVGKKGRDIASNGVEIEERKNYGCSDDTEAN